MTPIVAYFFPSHKAWADRGTEKGPERGFPGELDDGNEQVDHVVTPVELDLGS
jgi:hypothetical protein